MAYHAAYLRQETAPAYVEHLMHYRPHILSGYPSLIAKLAEYILEKEISLPFKIKGVELDSESTYGWQLKRIRRAFSPNITLQYGHAEMCVFAYTVDDSHEYVCSPFFGLVEVLGSDGKPAPPGGIGEIVVTGFHNHALPFIRYRTGDLAVLCRSDNGVVRLREVLGRAQDYIVTRRGPEGFVATPFHSTLFGDDYDALRNITNWQLVQDAPGEVVLKIVPREGFSQADEAQLTCMLTSFLDVTLTTEFVDAIPPSSSGKYQLIVQNVGPDVLAVNGEGAWQ